MSAQHTPGMWIEFEITGPVDVARYRTNADATVVEYWCAERVPGFARKGWNRTRSATVAVRARAAIAHSKGMKDAQA